MDEDLAVWCPRWLGVAEHPLAQRAGGGLQVDRLATEVGERAARAGLEVAGDA